MAKWKFGKSEIGLGEGRGNLGRDGRGGNAGMDKGSKFCAGGASV